MWVAVDLVTLDPTKKIYSKLYHNATDRKVCGALHRSCCLSTSVPLGRWGL